MKRLLALALAWPVFAAWAQSPATNPRSNPSRPVVPAKPKSSDSGSKTLRDAIDELSDADIREFLGILREHYINPDALGDSTVARATTQGLIERLAPGVILPFGPASEKVVDSPFRSEVIDNRVGYIRLGSLGQSTTDELDTALRNFASKKLTAAILDLRATPSGSQFSTAAQICERFSPKGRILFTIRRPSTQQEMILTSKSDPAFSGVIVTLVDADTAGAAEVIAAVLRTQAKALIIGQQTRGEAVEYEQVPLPSGRHLRVAVAEVALPENVLVFPGGVVPDVAVDVAQEDTERILKAELENGVSQMVVENERVRLNEAALVAGTNPELDAARAAASARGKKSDPVVRDAALQRALDAITTIALFEQPAKPVR